MRRYYIFILFLMSLLPVTAYGQITWTEVEPGVWRGVVGAPEAWSLLKAAGCAPQKDALGRLPKGPVPSVSARIKSVLKDNRTMLSIPLERKEQIYGFGLNFKSVKQRGKIMNLHVDHYGGKDNGRTHAPVPFYVSSEGYGLLVNSARYINVYVGSGVRKDSPDAETPRDRNTDKRWHSRPYSDEISMVVPAGGVELYLFAGPAMMDVVQRYNLFCGGGPLPPRWGLGFTQRTKTRYTAAEVEAEVDSFASRGFPLDFIGLEPGWQSKAYPCTMEWDTGRYPDPAGFISRLAQKGVRVNLWTNPYISPDAKNYKDLYPWSGSHTVWGGIVPDLATAEGRSVWTGVMSREHIDKGVSGYKIDEIDGYDHYIWPDIAEFPSGLSGEQMRQTFGVMTQKATYELFRERNKRTYGLVRGSNAGACSYPYVIYNDYYSHPDFITALANSGFCGVLWTPEVRSSKSAEEWVRRFQTVAFSPLAMLNAWSSGMKPWSFPEVTDIVKYYATLRMKMMPYWYSAFARYHYEGIPPFRAVYLDFGNLEKLKMSAGKSSINLEENPYLEKKVAEIKDQYMAGDYLMVAPLFKGDTERQVVLPPCDWYDFYTGEYVGNGEIITVKPGLERIPVFVRDGGIVPMMPERLHAPAASEKVDIEVRHYGKAEGTFRLYDDDGETFDYERGAYSWRTLSVTRDAKGRLKGSISRAENGRPNTVGRVTWKFMTKERRLKSGVAEFRQ